MDPPQVQVPSSETPQNQNQSQNTESQNQPQNPNPENQDVKMNGTQEANGRNEGEGNSQQDVTLPDAQAAEPEGAAADQPEQSEQPEQPPAGPPTPAKKNPGLKFLDYLTSPIVELIVGTGDDETVLTAHQNLLVESPYLAESITNLSEANPRRISLPDENVEALSCFLQFQYTRGYATLQEQSEQPTVDVDNTGDLLLKHARIYTLAEKLGIPSLKTLAHSKIHRINSSPHGEIAYARYVYTHTPVDDTTIRRPVAAFWASRSHILRHETEDELKKLCLEVPEFCFDVLTLVLDQKEKRSQDKAEADSGARASGRKRHRSGV